MVHLLDIPATAKEIYLKTTIQAFNLGIREESQKLPPTAEAAEQISKFAVLHEIGDLIWEIFPDALKHEWKKVEPKAGLIHDRNKDRKFLLDFKSEGMTREKFSDSFALFKQPQSLMGNFVQLDAEQIKVMQEVEDFLNNLPALKMLPGTYQSRSELRNKNEIRDTRQDARDTSPKPARALPITNPNIFRQFLPLNADDPRSCRRPDGARLVRDD